MQLKDDFVEPVEPEEGLEDFIRTSDALFSVIRSARGHIAEGSGLTLSQIRLLAPLADSAAMPVGRLAEASGVAAPTATRMLQALERAGSVVRRRAAHSDRVVEIVLTPAGKRALADQTARLRERQRRVYESIDVDERERVVNTVRMLIALTRDVYDVPDHAGPGDVAAI